MAQRVERHAAQPPGRVVAESIGHEAMRRLVERNREDDRQSQGRNLLEFVSESARNSCGAPPATRRTARRASPIDRLRRAARSASPRVDAPPRRRRQAARRRRRSRSSPPCRRCNAGRGRSRRRARRRALAEAAAERRIDRSSDTSTPSKPMLPRITCSIDACATASPGASRRSRHRRYARSSPRACRRARGTARNRWPRASCAALDDVATRDGCRRWRGRGREYA